MIKNANNPPRILHVIYGKFGGGDSVVFSLVDMAREHGLRVDVLSDCKELTEYCATRGIEVVQFHGIIRPIRPWTDIRAILRLTRLLRQRGDTLVHTHTTKGGAVGRIAARLAGIPMVLHTVHGFAFHEFSSRLATIVVSSIERIMAMMCDRVIFVNNYDRAKAVNRGIVPKHKAVTVFNGISEEQLAPGLRASRDELNIPADGVVIGVVARLTGDKGINELVTAVTDMAEEMPYIYLLVVGPAEEKDRLSAETDNTLSVHPRIRAVGRRKDAMPYYMAMDIFCLPTYREGFGKTNLEAQAMELPVVSTDVIGPRESIEKGQTGFLVEPKSSKALVEPLKKLVTDPELRKEMGRRGRRRVEQMFKQEAVVQAMVEHRLRLLRKA